MEEPIILRMFNIYMQIWVTFSLFCKLAECHNKEGIWNLLSFKKVYKQKAKIEGNDI